jgi:hypothetical protein
MFVPLEEVYRIVPKLSNIIIIIIIMFGFFMLICRVYLYHAIDEFKPYDFTLFCNSVFYWIVNAAGSIT